MGGEEVEPEVEDPVVEVVAGEIIAIAQGGSVFCAIPETILQNIAQIQSIAMQWTNERRWWR